MPRRPKPPKHGQPDLVVQKLSTGEIVRPKSYVDELTGKVMPLPEHYGPHKPPADAYAKHVAEREQIRMSQHKLLEAVRIIPGHGYHLNKPKPKALAHNQLQTESGLVITVGKARSWRRL